MAKLEKVEILPFDAAAHLTSDDAKLALLNDAIDSGHAGYIAHAIGTIARAEGGLSWLEKETGQKRQSLHKSFGPGGNPSLATLLPVLEALGLRMRIERAPPAGRRRLARA